MLYQRFKVTLRYIARADFMRREDGVIALEAMIILPAMFWAFLTMFSIFHSFRTHGLTQRAAYSLGDAISRETVPIDGEYLTGLHQLFEYLSNSQGDSTIRVTSILYDQSEDRYYRDWSQTRGGGALPLSNSDVENWHNVLPVMPDRERVIVVETFTTYEAPFRTGLEEREIRNFVFTRPRYAPRVCWETCPDGI
ncbi:TadE/TadG family type IV pilus assembly protein [Sulfitobacter sp. M368]|uniref:TadE/TadG family type IV pilus assembly protein n=1 Tax=Sulfitobacter sp. M368 TaxID=2867021 RepID=UPI0021A42DC8|nr:hypothetical protein [Sulfitobacter sp. M368]UWR14219.1 hypothetical protein K3754_12985 [Sulfitobacter sp. M368]